MSELLERLGSKARKGSKPRCHWLTHGTREEVAVRLTKLIDPWGAVSRDDQWMPEGFENTDEAQLHQTPSMLSTEHCEKLHDWWLAVRSSNSKTPNFDIAFTCQVGGTRGIAIVEAKAHNVELEKETAGKLLSSPMSANSKRNHARIACCIKEANYALAEQTGIHWALSHEWCYQMSNRFTWSWKLNELGYPVILVYLGFLNAQEMKKGKKQRALIDHQDWSSLVLRHSAPLFPKDVWNHSHKVHRRQLIPIIRSIRIPFDSPCTDCEVQG